MLKLEVEGFSVTLGTQPAPVVVKGLLENYALVPGKGRLEMYVDIDGLLHVRVNEKEVLLARPFSGGA